ncbi:MAG: hypothetical protein AB7O26_09345 [Planctomycetaceae bacterium]
MNVGSLSSAAFTALNGLGKVVQQVEQVATNVAAGVANPPGGSFSEGLAEIVKLPMLEQQARANVRVFSTAEEMLEELARMPRR